MGPLYGSRIGAGDREKRRLTSLEYLPMDELQALYDSEINFQISTFYDNGFEWKLGDILNGWKAEGRADTLKEAVHELIEAAVTTYSNSDFAKRHTS